MAAQSESEIILYDLASTKNVCFSPTVWRIRLMLNYKRIPYKTVFLEFPDIAPTLKGFGIPLNAPKYTVPAIHHIQTNTYMMDSSPIAQFIESTYPGTPILLTSKLGTEVELKVRAALGPAAAVSIAPREMNILSPRAQDFFRIRCEERLGPGFEKIDTAKEERAWAAADAGMRAAGELILTNQAQGPFVHGAKPSYTDFSIAGAMRAARVVDEGVFQRIVRYAGFEKVYEACLPYMERDD